LLLDTERQRTLAYSSSAATRTFFLMHDVTTWIRSPPSPSNMADGGFSSGKSRRGGGHHHRSSSSPLHRLGLPKQAVEEEQETSQPTSGSTQHCQQAQEHQHHIFEGGEGAEAFDRGSGDDFRSSRPEARGDYDDDVEAVESVEAAELDSQSEAQAQDENGDSQDQEDEENISQDGEVEDEPEESEVDAADARAPTNTAANTTNVPATPTTTSRVSQEKRAKPSKKKRNRRVGRTSASIGNSAAAIAPDRAVGTARYPVAAAAAASVESRHHYQHHPLSNSGQFVAPSGVGGVVQTKHDEKWNEMFERLVLYKEQNDGSTLVPQCYHPFPKLGRWVHYQRGKVAGCFFAAEYVS